LVDFFESRACTSDEMKHLVWAFLLGAVEDRDVRQAVEAAKRDGYALASIPTDLCGDKEVVLKAVRQNTLSLYLASAPMRADRDVALAGVAENGQALQYVAKPLRADKEVVLVAVRRSCNALMYAAEPHRDDLEVVLAALDKDQNASVLSHAVLSARGRRDFMLADAALDTLSLRYAAKNLCDDKEVVIIAVAQNALALKSATARLQADNDITSVPGHAHRLGRTRWDNLEGSLVLRRHNVSHVSLHRRTR
jgi:hypothetical protein